MKKENGQAVLEYILIFGLLALITVQMVKGVNSIIVGSMGTLKTELSKELTTGICNSQWCFDRSRYVN